MMVSEDNEACAPLGCNVSFRSWYEGSICFRVPLFRDRLLTSNYKEGCGYCELSAFLSG